MSAGRLWSVTLILVACSLVGIFSRAGALHPSPSKDEVSRLDQRKEPAAPASTLEEPVRRAKRAIADCQKRFATVLDYTCTFAKRERIDGTLTSRHVMNLKARTTPESLYFKFLNPKKGREAIYVSGRHGGKFLAHDVGLGRLIAGTMILDPRGPTAMVDCRHPITEAGIGSLIENVAKHWSLELTPEESRVVIDPNMTIGSHRCTMIESVHAAKQPNFLFHKVRLFVDQEHGLPIRFEAYDWPKQPGGSAELVEEYLYLDLKVNVGLTDRDFDPSNKSYSFGRF